MTQQENPMAVTIEAQQQTPQPPKDGQWFVIHTYSGYEDRVKKDLEQRIASMDMHHKIYQVVVPTENEMEIRDGQRRTVLRKVFSGYVLVQMKLDNESWAVVRNTPRVTGFVGTENRPTPLEDAEVKSILRQMESETPRMKIGFAKGQSVRIIDGPFTDFIGVVDELHPEKGKVRVLLSFFGKETPVEMDYLQVEKL